MSLTHSFTHLYLYLYLYNHILTFTIFMLVLLKSAESVQLFIHNRIMVHNVIISQWPFQIDFRKLCTFSLRDTVIYEAIWNSERLIKSEIEFLIFILPIRCQPWRHLKDGWSGGWEIRFLRENRYSALILRGKHKHH